MHIAQISGALSAVAQLEAVFLAPGTRRSEATLAQLRSACPEAVCLALGCELSEEAYLNLRAQPRGHDAELAVAMAERGCPSTPPRPEAPEPEPEHSAGDVCRARSVGSAVQRADGHGPGEIPRACPGLSAVFFGAEMHVTDAGLEEFRRQSPSVRCLCWDARCRGGVLALLRIARGPSLDLCRPAGGARLSAAAVSEALALCQGGGGTTARAAWQQAADRLRAVRAQYPQTHFVSVGDG